MLYNKFKSALIKSGLATVLLLASGATYAQQQVNLTAGPTTTTLPDGSVVPMWGYSCAGATVIAASSATCALLNPAAAATLTAPATWSPVVITVPTGQDLQINLINNLTFGATPNNIPTSLVIVGQLGGGLGTPGGFTLPPDHTNAQPLTWPVAGTLPGVPAVGVGKPPTQGNRVQSFSTEVLVGTPATLCWGTSCPVPTPTLKPGTYLIESGTHPSIQASMGLYGILVVTTAPATGGAGTAYPAAGPLSPAVTYSAEVPLLLSEIDPVQNSAVSTAVNTVGFAETTVWSGQPGGCGNPVNADGSGNTTYQQCYPPTVNYTPLYYLFNGVAFNKTNAAASLFPVAPAAVAPATVTGNILVRLVNAGSRMHVPAIVGAQTGTTPVSGFGLIAEDGNRLPGVTRIQNEVFMAAGKTYDVMINAPTVVGTALPIYDRELSLSGNATARDAGMLAYIGINGASTPAAPGLGTAVARADTYNSLVPCAATPCAALTVLDPAKGLIANDTNVNGVTLLTAPTHGTLTLNLDGTFSYVSNSTGTPATADSFTYCANGSVAAPVPPATVGTCSSGIQATVTLGVATLEAASGISMAPITYTSNVTSFLSITSPGILSVDKDGAGYPLTVNAASVAHAGGMTLTVDPHGGFNMGNTGAGAACPSGTPAGSTCHTFTYKAQNSQGTVSSSAATVTVVFPAPTGLAVTVLDGKDVLAKKLDPTVTVTTISDYRWIIEEDRTFYVNPKCTTNPPAAGCPGASTTGITGTAGIVPTFGTNFHTSWMPVVATGCTGPLSCESGQSILDPQGSGNHLPAVCDVGNGVCRTTAAQFTMVNPNRVHLDPTKRYYLSVLPGDAGNPFYSGNFSADCANGAAAATSPGTCGHGMGGAPLMATCTIVPPATTCTPVFPAVTVLTQPDPYPPAKLSVFVFEDDFPLNGEQDGGGGIDVLSPNEPGLGQFNITMFDDAGGPGDPTGQMTYDMFNQPLSNSLAGTPDPNNKNVDACPISAISQIGMVTDPNNPTGPKIKDVTQTGITSTIVTCPKYEADGVTLSPLAGQAVVANLMPGRYGVVATPAADRIARGEEWLQTNTLDGQKAHDSFLRIGEPSFFQEFGPAGYHVSIGFANPKIINSRLAGICGGTDPNLPGVGGAGKCANSVSGTVTTERMSRTPDERLYSSGSRASFAFTQCYVSFGDPDGEDFAFTKCDKDGKFTLSGLPDGDWRLTTFDQWNDQLVDGLSTPVRLAGGKIVNLGDIAANQWQANFYTRTFMDSNKDGISQGSEPGLPLVKTNVRFRDGSFSNRNNTDLNGYAGFNEEFPLFSWYVIETDVSRFKNTGTHVVYDAGGPADGTPCGGTASAPCGTSSIADHLANTIEQVSLPTNLRVPGAVYCQDADCSTHPTGIAGGPGSSDPPSACTTSPTTGGTTCSTTLSTGRIDPPWVLTEGWQGFSGQNSFMEFGKTPYIAGENGGIRGHVVYSSTRPFDDPQFGTQNVWEPLVPGVTINLYQEGTAADGITPTLTLIDHTKSSSFDEWAQGFRSDGVPNMNCPGQLPASTSAASGDLFFFTLFNQPMYLDLYNNGGTPAHTVPYNSQFKCYDGMHNWNQVQPTPYDGMYQFPSVTGLDPATGKPTGTNCTACTPNPDASDPYRSGLPMLPRGKYVVEVVVPPGYTLVKEEDKNILIGDNFIAPVTQQFPGLGTGIFILPDQAAIGATYNANSVQNPTQSFGRAQPLTSHEGDTPTVDTFWPCVGATRIVPDYISLFPGSTAHEVAPFAGAKRNLCDRKEVTLDDQTSSQAEFFVFTPTHAAAHFTGVITDDFTSEFDPFSPQFGEKFSPANLPVAIKDWTGTEISRVYADQWGTYDGMTYSTWEVNPPNPTGYAPTMMVTCMNDPGTGPTPDPLYNPSYSQFCYEIPFMPGQTQYMDTPVVPTSAFAGAGYNNPDCAYPDATPAVSEVDGGTGIGPWVSAAGQTLHIFSLGNATVNNYGYAGPSATTTPFNQKTAPRHYGFGSTAGTVALVGLDGVPHNLTSVTWSDTSITGVVPSGVPNCAIQQQAQYGGSNAKCGELVITAANGKQSIDTVTVTIGGSAPKHVVPNGSIQTALDTANPGDMIMIDPLTRATVTAAAVPAVHNELLIMWKPVRLQGVGAVSSVINANTHPAGKLDVWRRQINCLFGLALNGVPPTSSNPYDASGKYSCPGTGWTNYVTNSSNPQIDRLPLEAVVGWDATQNGNLAELLQEPSLMGALEGAAITVLSKGLNFPAGSDPFGLGTAGAGAFPVGTALLSAADCTANPNPYPSNFWCNPSSIDGMSVTNGSQGGGGIYVHGWGHNIQIANNRVTNNTGTLSGGISVGQGEFAPSYTVGGTNAAPGSCQNPSGLPAGTELQYCFDVFVNIHHNAISLNSSTGDELFSATPAGAGGVSICNGSDYYKFNYNWLCGNLSTGDGGGLAHIGFSYNGDIEHNAVLFNQSTNPTIATNGGGILIMGAPDVDPACGSTTDADCVPATPNVPGDGTGPGLVINANLIMGNSAESGSGGGLRLQNVNGTDLLTFPTAPANWYSVSVTNNIIADNVAGWDGAGISLQDALAVNIINNTIVSNDTTASSGVLFNTFGAPLASSSGTNCIQPGGTTHSCPQVAGVVAIQNSVNITANLPATITCPAGHYAGTTASNGTCRSTSYPELYNNAIWQNRAFYIGVGTLGTGAVNQQNVVALYNAFTGTAAASQPMTDATTANGGGAIITGGTGACTTASYWDIGVRGDLGPNDHSSTVTLTPTYSVLTSAANYPGLNNTDVNPTFLSQYCNGSRVPPEFGSMGYQVNPGISDATVPNPIFNLTPAATVDEGNNWINIGWGPLALVNESSGSANGTLLGNYSPAAGSSVINYIPSSATVQYAAAPSLDFYGTARKTNGAVDAGAVEFAAAGGGTAVASVTGGPLAFGNVATGTTSASQTLRLSNTGTAPLTGVAVAATAPFSRAGGTCTATLAQGTTCTITVVFSPTALGAATGTATITGNVAVGGSPVAHSGTGVAAVSSASVSPTSLAFGNWAASTTSNARAVTVTNTGTVALAGGTFTFGGGTPQPFSRAGAGGTCGATLAVGAACTINVVFAAPATAANFSRTLTVAYTGSATVTGSPVTLTGTGVASQAAVTIAPPTITLAAGTLTGTGTATLTNTEAAGGAQVTISNVAVTGNSGSSPLTWFFNQVAGSNTCAGIALAPQANCTVGVRFTNGGAARPGTHTGTITFTDNALASPQSGTLTGVAQ
jgi:hypothetical protein